MRRPAARVDEESPERGRRDAEEEKVWRDLHRLPLDDLYKKRQVVIEGRYILGISCGDSWGDQGNHLHRGDGRCYLACLGYRHAESFLEGDRRDQGPHLPEAMREAGLGGRPYPRGALPRSRVGDSGLVEEFGPRGASTDQEDPLARLRWEAQRGAGEVEYTPEVMDAPVAKGAVEEEKKEEKEEVPLRDIFKNTGLDPDVETRRAL